MTVTRAAAEKATETLVAITPTALTEAAGVKAALTEVAVAIAAVIGAAQALAAAAATVQTETSEVAVTEATGEIVAAVVRTETVVSAIVLAETAVIEIVPTETAMTEIVPAETETAMSEIVLAKTAAACTTDTVTCQSTLIVPFAGQDAVKESVSHRLRQTPTRAPQSGRWRCRWFRWRGVRTTGGGDSGTSSMLAHINHAVHSLTDLITTVAEDEGGGLLTGAAAHTNVQVWILTEEARWLTGRQEGIDVKWRGRRGQRRSTGEVKGVRRERRGHGVLHVVMPQHH